MSTRSGAPIWRGTELARYLREISDFPLLSVEEEVSLARRVRALGDRTAVNALVNSHLRLVAKIATGYRGYGLPLDDLVAEGNIGLLQAAERFDPERGTRLATYALWWIRASIHDYILRNWSLVRMGTTRAQKALFFNLRRLKAQLGALDDGELKAEAVATIATTLAVPEADVVAINRRLAGADRSLNVPVREDGEGEWQDWLADDADDQEIRLIERDLEGRRRRLFDDTIRGLSERERGILKERHLQERPSSLDDLSGRYGISRERVRQIEVAAIEKVKREVARRAREPVGARVLARSGLGDGAGAPASA